jgi:polyisoprenoid-binding protein YceI
MKNITLTVLFLFSIIGKASLYEINEDHSKVNFEVEYMTLTKVQGQFKNYEGTFKFDEKSKTIEEIQAKIFARSIDTNEAKRDFHLKSHEFLFASNFPEITFTTNQKITLKEKKNLKISGILEIRGIKKNVTGDIMYKGHMIDPWGKENLFIEFKTQINRKDFGMNWNKELDQGGYLVGDLVSINLSIQAQKAGEKTAFSTHMIPSTKAIKERELLKKGKLKKLSTSTDPKDHK